MSESREDPAVTRLREYLAIPSVHPDVDYKGCVDFLEGLTKDMGIPCRVLEMAPGKPVVLMTYKGTDPGLPSILLNSHMDVVPVQKELWSRDPFAAEKDSNGRIYARGAQDMKSSGIIYMEAVRRLKDQSVVLPRTIHICFVPDEEIGSVLGASKLVEHEEFKKLNVGCVFDESVADMFPNEYVVFCNERLNHSFRVRCKGPAGHGSILMPNTAAEKLTYVLASIDKFRKKELQVMKEKRYTELHMGHITTVNLTMITGGLQTNIIPPEFVATFDCRLSPDRDPDEFDKWLQEVCKEAGDDVTLEIVRKEEKVEATKQDDSNPYWLTLISTAQQMGISLRSIVSPGCSDSRFYRKVGIPSFGLTPLDNTPLRLHSHDECVDEDVFLKGIDFYHALLKNICQP